MATERAMSVFVATYLVTMVLIGLLLASIVHSTWLNILLGIPNAAISFAAAYTVEEIYLNKKKAKNNG